MAATEMYDLGHIGRQFNLPGRYEDGRPWGSGHIHETFRVVYDEGGTAVSYLFQRLNQTVFRDLAGLMHNIERIGNHLASRPTGCAGVPLLPLEFYPCSVDGTGLFHDETNETYWRVCDFVPNSRTLDIAETGEQAYEAARAFGAFQCALLDLPGAPLVETIPGFHDGPRRYAAFEDALDADAVGRAASAKHEIEFVQARKGVFARLADLHSDGVLPERITHNDCKLNNVLFDRTTGNAVCIVDLDTVMPGFVAYDFGDLVRSATSPAAEDELDLDRVTMQMPMFCALARGYVESARGFLTDCERELLAFAGKLMTLTLGTRFLTDHLAGDVYFGARREGHNLDRCRAQFKLVESIEAQQDEMEAFVSSL